MSNHHNSPPGLAPRAEETILICRLALERCQQNLAHLHAILHFCLPEPDLPADNIAAASIRQIIASLEQELSYSVDALCCGLP